MGIFDAESSDPPSFATSGFASSTAENTGGIDRELEDFLLHEKQKATINAQIHEFNDLCWEKCLTDKPSNKLSGKAENCLSNCVNRFIDTTAFIMNRFAVSVQKNSKLSL